jgi:ubiquinone/menaquinone biosynthesis C-methylase UbiE
MTGEESHRLYSAVDRAADPQALVEHMDRLRSLDPFRQVKQLNFELLQLRPGQSVLDVGSGPGDDVRDLARLVGPGGRAVGVDASETMVAAARERSAGLELPGEFQSMDAAHLDFQDDTFDGVRADRVLQHVDDPTAVLREMMRVTKRGGMIAVSDTDWGMMGVDMSDPPLTRRILEFGFSQGIHNPWIGRQLPRLAREVGLLELQVAPHAVIMPPGFTPPDRIPLILRLAVEKGIISAEEGAAWKQEYDEGVAAGSHFAAIVMFTVAGRKP